MSKKSEKSTNTKPEVHRSINCEITLERMHGDWPGRKWANEDKEEESAGREEHLKEEPSIVNQHIE
jgi:hypothetical protein